MEAFDYPPGDGEGGMTGGMPTWFQVATGSGPSTGHELDQVSVVACDQFAEALWLGTKEGRIASLLAGTGERYSVFRAHEGEVRQILLRNEGVLSVGGNSVAFTTRGGLPKLRLTGPSIMDLHTACYTGTGEKYLLAGQQQTCLVFEATRGKIVKELMVDKPIFLMKRGRLLCCASSGGEIHLRDPKSLQVEYTLPAHQGGIYDLDVEGNIMVTCGYAERSGRVFRDSLIKVFDLRMMRPLPPVPFAPGPIGIKLHPLMASVAAVVSQSGTFQFIEVGGMTPIPSLQFNQVDLAGRSCTVFDLSSNGEIMAFGDSDGFVHQCSDRGGFSMNAYSQPLEFALPLEIPDFHLDEGTPLSSVGMPHYDELLLSAWPPNQTYTIGQPSPPIDPEVLNNIKQKDFVGYAPNPGTTRRNQVYKKHKTGDRPKFRSEQERDPAKKNMSLHHGPASTEVQAVKFNAPPNAYQRVEIQYSKLGVEDFDFGFYNKTKFTGLETHLAFSYCNSMLQVLYFLPPFRHLMAFMSTMPSPETTLSCELGFLFKMMDNSRGQNCHAGNFLKVFGSLPQVAALGLHEPDNPTVDTMYGTLIQNFNRFLLEHLQLEMSKSLQHNPLILRRLPTAMRASSVARFEHLVKRQLVASDLITEVASSEAERDSRSPVAPEKREKHHHHPHPSGQQQPPPSTLSSVHSPIHQLFGMQVTTSDTCSQCKAQNSRDAFPFVIDLLGAKRVKESRPGQSQEGLTFGQVLETSINREMHPKAWCATCGKYQYTTQKKFAQSLPNILSLNCGGVGEEDMALWKGDKGVETPQVFDEEGSLQSDPKIPYSPWIPTWLEARINSTDNSLQITEIRDPAVALSTIQGMVAEEQKAREEEAARPLASQTKATDDTFVNKRVVYELVGVVAEIRNPNEPSHLVAHIRVPEFYHESITATPKGSRHAWYLFNDFRVSPISEQKALYFHPAWKTPVILYYSSVEIEDRVDVSFLPTHLDLSLLTMDDTIPRANHFYMLPKRIPLFPNEIPRKGYLCALDAEFVSTKEEEMEIRVDGTKRIIKPAQLTLARVSVVRGWGPKEGVAFIDDYIHVTETIIDYLTKYSGINPGDLDLSMSPHPLTTRKSAYTKLRLLSDQGCIFVGHGLKQDFRIINMLVPPEQVIDTVEIYRLKGHRKISLRFLAWYILNKDVQRDTHDSIEDAKTALELYKRFIDLKRRGIFDKTLEEVYEYGRAHNWEIGNHV